MVCSGFEPGTAGWKAQTNPLSYGFEYLEKDSVQLPIRMPNQTTFSVNSLLYLDNGSKFMKHFIECKFFFVKYFYCSSNMFKQIGLHKCI